MNGSADTTGPVLAALAVVERAHEAFLDTLVEDAGGTVELRDHPSVQADDANMYALPAATAHEIRSALKRDDPDLYRTLHEKALSVLGERLRAGDSTHEPTFVAVFERLANHLLTDAPAQFIELMDQVRDIPLEDTGAKQRRHYFEGVALTKAERYDDAIAQFDALLSAPSIDRYVQARAENSRAVCCRFTGQLEAALAGYRRSLALWRQLGNRRYEGIVWMNMGITAYELQQYAQAEEHLLRAAGIFEDSDAADWYAVVQNELGLVYRDLGQWEPALEQFERFVAARRAAGADDDVGLGLNNIGEVLLFQGRLDEALATFREALDRMTTRVYRIDTYLHLGLAHQARGNASQARTAYAHALDLAEEIDRREILPHVHYRLAEILRRLGEHQAATAHFQAGVRAIESSREPLVEEAVKISLLGRWQQVYEAFVLYCFHQGQVAEAFEWAERARARAFAEALLGGERDDAQEALQSVSAAEVQAALPAGAVVLCYFTTGVLERDVPLLRAIPEDSPVRPHLLTPARTLLFVITSERITAHECPLDPNAFASGSPRGFDPERLLSPAARTHLRRTLLDVAGDAAKAHRLHVIPHGPLHYVPFTACLASDEREAAPVVTYAPSATVLIRDSTATPSRQTTERCLAIGYRGSVDGERLRYAELEAQLIADRMAGEALVGPAVTTEQVHARAQDRRWLHFACHGVFDYERPLAAYLEIGTDQRLTARDVLRDWSLRADLVTLSACQTGTSRILRGDEPMGLARAFLSAGARAVLVTQWKVADLPTVLLAYRFYSELQQGRSAGAALTEAQTWLRTATTAEVRAFVADLPDADTLLAGLPSDVGSDARPYAHPRYWAGFVLVGGRGSGIRGRGTG